MNCEQNNCEDRKCGYQEPCKVSVLMGVKSVCRDNICCSMDPPKTKNSD